MSEAITADAVVEPVVDADLSGLAQLMADLPADAGATYTYAEALEKITAAVAAGDLVLCVRENGRLIGMAWVRFSPVSDNPMVPRDAYYMLSAVASDVRNRGIGTRLGRAAVNAARLHGVDYMYSLVAADNAGARRQTERRHYSQVDDGWQGGNGVLYRRALANVYDDD